MPISATPQLFKKVKRKLKLKLKPQPKPYIARKARRPKSLSPLLSPALPPPPPLAQSTFVDLDLDKGEDKNKDEDKEDKKDEDEDKEPVETKHKDLDTSSPSPPSSKLDSSYLLIYNISCLFKILPCMRPIYLTNSKMQEGVEALKLLNQPLVPSNPSLNIIKYCLNQIIIWQIQRQKSQLNTILLTELIELC